MTLDLLAASIHSKEHHGSLERSTALGSGVTSSVRMQDATTLPRLWQPGKQNAVEITEPLSPYEMLTGLLVPLYAARAAEEAFYGPRGVTLSTSKEALLCPLHRHKT